MKKRKNYDKGQLSNTQVHAALVAMCVRNSLEDFHVKHLSDAQMAELNPIVRNAIYEAFVMLTRAQAGDEKAKKAAEWLWRCIPAYWEPPKLSKAFRKNIWDGE